MTEADSNILLGCDFDAQTAKFLAGKDVIAMVTTAPSDEEEAVELLAVAGQQSLSFNMSAPNSSATTKDSGGNGWLVRYYTGGKTWDANIDGLWNISDEAAAKVAGALANDELLCLAICERIKTATGYKYVPVRKGTALVSSHNFRAPNEDNSTYTMNFEGTGEPWLRETHTDAEVEAATIEVQVGTAGSAGGTEGEDDGSEG